MLQAQACPIIRYSVDPSQVRDCSSAASQDRTDVGHAARARLPQRGRPRALANPAASIVVAFHRDARPSSRSRHHPRNRHGHPPAMLAHSRILSPPRRGDGSVGALPVLVERPSVLADHIPQLCANEVFTAVQDLLDGLKLEAVKVILHALNTVFQLAPPALWAGPLDASGCFPAFVKAISANVRACRVLPLQSSRLTQCLQDHSALIVSKCQSSFVSTLTWPTLTELSADLCSISRIILADPATFHTLVAATASRLNATSDQILELVLTQFIERVRLLISIMLEHGC